MNASDLLGLLAVRHSGDVFVPECKNGPTHGANHLRLDAWAMKKSWVNPCYDGYEIKVSRSDFMADQKMHLYLPLCNRLWLVCPSGLVQPAEIPETMGLLWAASTGSKLLTKKKAPYREIEPPDFLLRYVLMCRSQIQRHDSFVDNESREDRAERFRDFVEGRRSLSTLGYEVSRRMGEEIRRTINEASEKVRAAEHRADEAERHAKNLSEVAAILEKLGIKETWALAHRVEEAASGMDLARSAAELEGRLARFREALARRLDANQTVPVSPRQGDERL